MELQRTQPIRPKLHSTPKNLTTVKPLSSDANPLFFENLELRKKNKILVQEYKKLKAEYDKLLGMVDLRKNVRKGMLDRRYRDERQDYISKMRDIHGTDLDLGTYTEEMLVGYNDPTIIDSPRVRKKYGGSSKKKKKKNKTRRKKNTKKKSNKRKKDTKNKLTKVCNDECKKTRKVMPLLLKKMGLSKTEISKKMKEHDEKCLGNCVKIIQDKDLMKQIMKK